MRVPSEYELLSNIDKAQHKLAHSMVYYEHLVMMHERTLEKQALELNVDVFDYYDAYTSYVRQHGNEEGFDFDEYMMYKEIHNEIDWVPDVNLDPDAEDTKDHWDGAC